MISELRITDPKSTCIPWWDSVKWLQGRENIKFTPGLNILWGPNGLGKSTVLQCLARMLHAEQGGVTTVTQSSMREVYNPHNNHYMGGASPIHDGRAVLHFDSGHQVGVMAGAFDWDFGMEGLRNTMFRGSAGQTTLRRGTAMLNALLDNKWPDIDWKDMKPWPEDEPEPPSTDMWKHRRWLITKTLAGTLEPTGPRTLLLDEPDRSLDFGYQDGLWKRILERASDVQVIVATHSPFALFLKDANYIETRKGYLALCEDAARGFAARVPPSP